MYIYIYIYFFPTTATTTTTTIITYNIAFDYCFFEKVSIVIPRASYFLSCFCFFLFSFFYSHSQSPNKTIPRYTSSPLVTALPFIPRYLPTCLSTYLPTSLPISQTRQRNSKRNEDFYLQLVCALIAGVWGFPANLFCGGARAGGWSYLG